jgi:hypothetical protein
MAGLGLPPQVTAVDCIPDRLRAWPGHWSAWCADWFRWAGGARERGEHWDVVPTNPPFSVWFEWVEAALPLVSRSGDLVAIGPVAYLAGQERARWWAQHRPTQVLISPKRPTGPGWEDTRDICAVHWRPSTPDVPTRLVWLEI